jgi:hypothetical protein
MNGKKIRLRVQKRRMGQDGRDQDGTGRRLYEALGLHKIIPRPEVELHGQPRRGTGKVYSSILVSK